MIVNLAIKGMRLRTAEGVIRVVNASKHITTFRANNCQIKLL